MELRMIVTFLERVQPGWLQGFGLRWAPNTWFPVLPGYAELFPGSGKKVPGSLATGIRPQPVASATISYDSEGRKRAKSTQFPVIRGSTGIFGRLMNRPSGRASSTVTRLLA
jgi:hypothetical protein